jgi:hypothetical protein
MSRIKDKNIDKFAGWPSALDKARQQMAEAQQRVKHLRRSILIIEEKIEAGEPWPGNVEVAGTEAESVPA